VSLKPVSSWTLRIATAVARFVAFATEIAISSNQRKQRQGWFHGEFFITHFYLEYGATVKLCSGLISSGSLIWKPFQSQKNSNIDEKFKISLNAFEVFSIFALGEVHSFFYNADTVLQFKYCYLVNFSVILTGILVMNTKRSKAKSAAPKKSSLGFKI